MKIKLNLAQINFLTTVLKSIFNSEEKNEDSLMAKDILNKLNK